MVPTIRFWLLSKRASANSMVGKVLLFIIHTVLVKDPDLPEAQVCIIQQQQEFHSL